MIGKLGRPGGPSTLHRLKFATFINHAKLQAPPLKLFLEGAPKALPIWKNDSLGDCTCATWATVFLQDAAANGKAVTFADVEVEKMYRASGWNGTDATDNGWSMDAAARYAQATGLRDATGVVHYSAGWLAVRHIDHDEVKIALDQLGALPVGVNLPVSAQSQSTWDTNGSGGDQAPGSWGGHSLTLVGYDHRGGWFRTWGKLQRFTWRWWDRYVDEMIGKIDPLWASGERPSPEGFLEAEAREALAELRA